MFDIDGDGSQSRYSMTASASNTVAGDTLTSDDVYTLRDQINTTSSSQNDYLEPRSYSNSSISRELSTLFEGVASDFSDSQVAPTSDEDEDDEEEEEDYDVETLKRTASSIDEYHYNSDIDLKVSPRNGGPMLFGSVSSDSAPSYQCIRSIRRRKVNYFASLSSRTKIAVYLIGLLIIILLTILITVKLTEHLYFDKELASMKEELAKQLSAANPAQNSNGDNTATSNTDNGSDYASLGNSLYKNNPLSSSDSTITQTSSNNNNINNDTLTDDHSFNNSLPVLTISGSSSDAKSTNSVDASPAAMHDNSGSSTSSTPTTFSPTVTAAPTPPSSALASRTKNTSNGSSYVLKVDQGGDPRYGSSSTSLLGTTTTGNKTSLNDNENDALLTLYITSPPRYIPSSALDDTATSSSQTTRPTSLNSLDSTVNIIHSGRGSSNSVRSNNSTTTYVGNQLGRSEGRGSGGSGVVESSFPSKQQASNNISEDYTIISVLDNLGNAKPNS